MNNLIYPTIETIRRPMRWPWVVVLGVVLVSIGSVWGWYVRGVNVPVSDDVTRIEVTITEGSSVDDIIAAFNEQGMIRSPLVFKIHTRFSGAALELKAGTYSLQKNSSTRDIVQMLQSRSGGADPNEVTITIIEGWTSQEIEDYLIKQGIDAEHFAETVQASQPTFNEAYLTAGLSTSVGAEGYLFPDTYAVYRDSTPEEIIQKMLNNFEKRVASAENKALAEKSGYTFYELLTVASIVENEMQTSRDRKIGAGIFLQRYADGYPLESDATINYITGKNITRPTADDLATKSSYNTYANIGLPPTPIGNPGLDSIRAALNPTKTDYYFFLHTPDGETIFSKTFEEHSANKSTYYPN